LREAAAIEVASLDLKELKKKESEISPNFVMIVIYACPSM
jgi:hypothetical protein